MTMLFDDGIVFICKLENTAETGLMPVDKLVKINKLWFHERTIGYNRQYLARGVDEQVDMLIRVIQTRTIRIGMYAVLGNGEQFRITNVQHLVAEENNLRYTDLTLERLNDNYELEE